MTNPMIERVAKAIEDALKAGYVAAISPTSVDDETGEADYSTFRFDGEITPLALARAAVEAMHGPTEAMVKRGDDAAGSLAITHDSSGAYVWQEMIDAAVKEE